MGVKLSISLPEEDVAVLDEYARTSGLKSRSAVIRRALVDGTVIIAGAARPAEG